MNEFVEQLDSSKKNIKITAEIVLKAIKSNGSQYAVGIDGISHIFLEKKLPCYSLTID